MLFINFLGCYKTKEISYKLISGIFIFFLFYFCDDDDGIFFYFYYIRTFLIFFKRNFHHHLHITYSTWFLSKGKNFILFFVYYIAGPIYLELYTYHLKVSVQVNVVDKFLRRSNESLDQFKSPYCTEEELVCS